MKRKETRETQILRSARKKSGLSQLQLATELDVQVRQYQRLEYGEQPFSTVNIRLGLKMHLTSSRPNLTASTRGRKIALLASIGSISVALYYYAN